MNELLGHAAAILAEFGFEHRHVEIPTDDGAMIEAVVFEDDTVLGFVLAYDRVQELLSSWKADGDRVAMKHRKFLQSAQQKAWNAYLVLFAREEAAFEQALALGLIEEDLEAMRKITKSGAVSATTVRNALLPLLPFRAAPVLDPIDMPAEIRARTSELDEQIVAAFLSSADEAVVLQLLEDRT